jgi:hypothetical protein
MNVIASWFGSCPTPPEAVVLRNDHLLPDDVWNHIFKMISDSQRYDVLRLVCHRFHYINKPLIAEYQKASTLLQPLLTSFSFRPHLFCRQYHNSTVLYVVQPHLGKNVSSYAVTRFESASKSREGEIHSAIDEVKEKFLKGEAISLLESFKELPIGVCWEDSKIKMDSVSLSESAARNLAAIVDLLLKSDDFIGQACFYAAKWLADHYPQKKASIKKLFPILISFFLQKSEIKRKNEFLEFSHLKKLCSQGFNSSGNDSQKFVSALEKACKEMWRHGGGFTEIHWKINLNIIFRSQLANSPLKEDFNKLCELMHNQNFNLLTKHILPADWPKPLCQKLAEEVQGTNLVERLGPFLNVCEDFISKYFTPAEKVIVLELHQGMEVANKGIEAIQVEINKIERAIEKIKEEIEERANEVKEEIGQIESIDLEAAWSSERKILEAIKESCEGDLKKFYVMKKLKEIEVVKEGIAFATVIKSFLAQITVAVKEELQILHRELTCRVSPTEAFILVDKGVSPNAGIAAARSIEVICSDDLPGPLQQLAQTIANRSHSRGLEYNWRY